MKVLICYEFTTKEGSGRGNAEAEANRNGLMTSRGIDEFKREACDHHEAIVIVILNVIPLADD
jgi:hypothetical protein